MSENQNRNTVFPKGDRAPADYCTGTTWVKMLVPNDDAFNCQIGNVIFEPRARNNWHMHPGGQILIATDGSGYYYEKGKPIQLFCRLFALRITPCQYTLRYRQLEERQTIVTSKIYN